MTESKPAESKLADTAAKAAQEKAAAAAAKAEQEAAALGLWGTFAGPDDEMTEMTDKDQGGAFVQSCLSGCLNLQRANAGAEG